MQKLTASLSLWHSRVVSLYCFCSMEGFGYQFGGTEQFCCRVLNFSLGMASLFLTCSIVPSLQSLGTHRRCQKMTHSEFAKEEDAVFLMLSLSLISNPVLGLDFLC